jgi:hypothetical protein
MHTHRSGNRKQQHQPHLNLRRTQTLFRRFAPILEYNPLVGPARIASLQCLNAPE